MDAKTKQAIEESIAHWEENVELAKLGVLYRIHIGVQACPLCAEFRLGREEVKCVGCPLKEAGKECDASGSPWRGVAHAIGFDYSIEGTTARAEKMLATLKQLLEESNDV